MLIDTHAHIYVEEFSNDLPAIISKAGNEGVEHILLPAIDSRSHEAMLQAGGQYPEICISMMGLHPCSVKENFEDELAIARSYLDKQRFIAIGETGLDFYWDTTFTSQQYISFKRQIEWALEFDIPVVIHSRNSTDECIAVIREFQKGPLKGVFHCFSGSLEQAQQIIELGFYLGIGGVVTFKNSGLDKVLSNVSIDSLVLETDAPYLAPVPFRGKRNEPSYLKYVVEKLSGIKQLSKDEISQQTTTNTKKLFSIKDR